MGSAPVLLSIAVTSFGGALALASGTTLALTATGTYSSGPTQDLTTLVTWTSGDTGAATIGSGTGVVTGAALSAAVVLTATLGAVSGTKTLSVYADFTALAAGAVTTLPGGLLLSRASSATVQTGTSTVVTTGITTDIGRAGRYLTTDPVGLVIEPTRTNNVKDCRDTSTANWSAGTVTETRPFGTAPDGNATTGTRTNTSTIGQFSRYVTVADNVAGVFAFSMWVTGNGSSQSAKWQPGTVLTAYTAGNAWQRQTASFTEVTGTYFLTPQQGTVCDIVHDLHQIETGGYPSEVIITGNATATRAPERLYTAGLSRMLVSARLVLAVRLRPKATAANYATDNATVTLWYVDASNNVSFAAATRVLTITIGGVTNTCTLAAWALQDTVRIQVSVGGSVASVVWQKINAGAAVSLTITGSALGSLSGSSIDLFCKGTAQQFGAHVEEVAVTAQTWAA